MLLVFEGMMGLVRRWCGILVFAFGHRRTLLAEAPDRTLHNLAVVHLLLPFVGGGFLCVVLPRCVQLLLRLISCQPTSLAVAGLDVWMPLFSGLPGCGILARCASADKYDVAVLVRQPHWPMPLVRIKGIKVFESRNADFHQAPRMSRMSLVPIGAAGAVSGATGRWCGVVTLSVKNRATSHVTLSPGRPSPPQNSRRVPSRRTLCCNDGKDYDTEQKWLIAEKMSRHSPHITPHHPTIRKK